MNNNILESNLDDYYSINDNIYKLHNILNDKKTSLRVLDWFVTNYSKKNNTYYNIYQYDDKKYKYKLDENDEYKLIKFNIYSSYKSQLKSFSKKYFDPFCRRQRISKTYKTYKLETTIGQLNFFKWCIDYFILDYVKENYNKIEKDMNDNIKISNKTTTINKKGTTPKRKELSKSIYNGLNKTNGKTFVYFD
jgi:hypothetical protein